MMSDTPAFMEWDLPGDPDPDRYPFREWQAGRCGICGTFTHRQHTDHDHDTGLVRGMLCPSCNIQEPYSSSPVFERWRAGMNPCATFGWYFVYTGYAQAREITSDEALALVRAAEQREREMQAQMDSPIFVSALDRMFDL